MSELTLQRHLHLTNDVMEVPRLTDFINDVCQSLGIEEILTMQLTLAVEEAAVNVMNYAYEPGTVGTVDLDAEAGDGELKIIISDSGVAFDPTQKAEADITLTAEERPIGGLGIFLVRQIMDNVSYRRQDGRNILTLTKKL
jgi:anti-sigma regulatory factor (Ser/Thr protein kinase)